MRPLLHLVVATALLAAGAFVCPAPAATALSPELREAYGANALHAHREDGDAAELHAPCPCGCDEAPVSAQGFAPLGVALLPTPPRAELPRALHATPARSVLPHAPLRGLDPVPKLV